ncbi:TetR/AcrR family transcriptional regulator [Nocardia sp. NPDC059239]|uniref:TetR/AcrR family transcriptional regulator n=1 Tax=unclassified Nocardia TaxID=2637762 RepID=UPI0036B1C798
MTDLVDGMALHMRSQSQRRRDVLAARAARRSQLQAAASEIFVLRGYHGACMEEIASRAGISKPILYQHFSGKLELYLAVLSSHADALVSEVLGALHSTSDNYQRVRAAVQAYFDFVDNETEGFRLVFESDVMSEPSVQRIVDRTNDACVDAIVEFITKAARLEPNKARALAVGLVGASQATARYWLDADRPVSKCDAVEASVALCWGGLSGLPLQTTDPSR